LKNRNRKNTDRSPLESTAVRLNIISALYELYICSEEIDFSTFEGRVVLVVNVARY